MQRVARMSKATCGGRCDIRPGLSRCSSRPQATTSSPTGKSAKSCQAPPEKKFLFPFTPNHLYDSGHPVPVEGRWPSSRTLGRDAAASGAWWCWQGGLWSVSEHSVQTTGANARMNLSAKTGGARRSLQAKPGGCVRQNRVVLAPVAGVKLTEAKSTQPGFDEPSIRQRR